MPAAKQTAGMNKGACGNFWPKCRADDIAKGFSVAKVNKKAAHRQPFLLKSLPIMKKSSTFAAAFRNHRSIRHRDTALMNG
jgi:hypothetical protein